MEPSSKIHLRPYQPIDAQTVVDLVNADASLTSGLRRAVMDGVGNIRLMRYVPVDSEKVVAVGAEGQILGYVYVVDKEQHILYEVGGAVHPGYWGQGIGTRLLLWAEGRASEWSQSAMPGIRTVLQANLFEGEQRAHRLFLRSGYQRVREWLHLQIELDGPPPVADLPPGMSLEAVDLENDWDLLGPAMDEAFADHWGTLDLSSMDEPEQVDEPGDDLPEDDSYSNAPGFCFKVLAGKEVAGGVLCNAKLVERLDTGRVGSVFVRRVYRRQGVGRALMLAAFGAFWQAGIRRVILDTDAQSFSQSLKFYSRLGMQVYRREFLYEKELRPGKEVRRIGG